MNQLQQKKAARAFAERWQRAEGSEDREGRSFWTELYQDVLGVASPTKVLDFEKQVSRGSEHRKADVFHEDVGVLVEMKSRGVDLDKPERRGEDRYGNPRMVTPFEQAKWYADNMTPRSIAPRWLVTCNFDELRVYDLDDPDCEASYETLLLSELPEQAHRLSFLVRKENSRLEREKELSIRAGEVVGRLYDALSGAYANIEDDAEEQRSLNILITRIVFLVFAEDAELLQEHQAFYKYLANFQTAHMRQALIDLFRVLNTPEDERDPYDDPALLEFPYVNGGLFADDILIPQLTEEIRELLLQDASAEFDWSKVSPTIFGAVFESTLNPETRRSGGMHYTSIENIHKVTGPLFYDALKDELTAIEGLKSEKERKFKLNAFRRKIASIKVLDPACGSGNFLTETYLSLRKLENRAMEQIYGDQIFMGDESVIQVSIKQFYGIEINDFAVSVAKTALWIAELQMMDQTREIMDMWIDPLPLKDNDNIVCANALRMDWGELVAAEECDYVIGNPPFYGARMQSKEQKAELQEVFNGAKSSGNVDYVAGWYVKAAEYMADLPIRAAFVSTNSICQGEQAAIVWKPLYDLGIHIDFAYDTFRWNSEATDQAHVFVIIIGFSKLGGKKTLFRHDTVDSEEVETHPANINAYLSDAPDVFVFSRRTAICDEPPMVFGSMPNDGGNLLMSTDEKDALVARDANAANFVHRFMGASEYINDRERWCVWLRDVAPSEYATCEPVRERVEAVREYRLASTRAATRKLADTPQLFGEIRQPETPYIIVPRHSSERRAYIPMGFLDAGVICGDSNMLIPVDSLYHFGIMLSQFHNAWMRVVCGRIKSDYRYSAGVVYNNFSWPKPTQGQRTVVERCAQAVLDARDAHSGDSLATLYDPDKMPDDLKAAHAALDAAVEAAYGVDFGGDEEKIVAHLFKLYADATRKG